MIRIANPTLREVLAIATAIGALLTLSSRGALAQTRATDQFTVVMIAPPNADDATMGAADAIAAQLGDLPVTFRLATVHDWKVDIPSRINQARQVADDLSASSVFWIDLYAEQQVFLYIADPQGGRILVRSITSQGVGIEARFETLAVIVRGAMKAILAGGEIGVVVPEQSPAESEKPTERLDISVDYSMQLYAPDKPLLHGATAGLSVGLGEVARLFVAYRLQLPLEVKTSLVSVDIRPHPMVAGIGARLGNEKWRLDTNLALVVDVITFDVANPDPAVEVDAPKRAWMVSLSPSVFLGRTAGKVATFYLGVGLDIALQRHSYVIDSAQGDLEVISPWRLRPIFQLGARFNLL